MHISSDGVLLELVWTFLASFQIGSNHIIHPIMAFNKIHGIS